MIEYTNYINIFSFDLAIEFPENTSINKHAIEQVNSKQPLYGPTYILSSIELETLKTYIKTYLKTRFIQTFKSLADALNLFDKNLNGSFCLYIDYQSFNNLTIKNWYSLSLIKISLNWLAQANQFIQLDLTSIYY